MYVVVVVVAVNMHILFNYEHNYFWLFVYIYICNYEHNYLYIYICWLYHQEGRRKQLWLVVAGFNTFHENWLSMTIVQVGGGLMHWWIDVDSFQQHQKPTSPCESIETGSITSGASGYVWLINVSAHLEHDILHHTYPPTYHCLIL